MGIILQIKQHPAGRKLPPDAATAGVHLVPIKDYPQPLISSKGPLQLIQVSHHFSGGVAINKFTSLSQDKVVENRNGDIIIGSTGLQKRRLRVEFRNGHPISGSPIAGDVSERSDRVGLKRCIIRCKNSPGVPRADDDSKPADSQRQTLSRLLPRLDKKLGALTHAINREQDPKRDKIILETVAAAGDEKVSDYHAGKEIKIEEDPASIFGSPGKHKAGQEKDAGYEVEARIPDQESEEVGRFFEIPPEGSVDLGRDAVQRGQTLDFKKGQIEGD